MAGRPVGLPARRRCYRGHLELIADAAIGELSASAPLHVNARYRDLQQAEPWDKPRTEDSGIVVARNIGNEIGNGGKLRASLRQGALAADRPEDTRIGDQTERAEDREDERNE